MKRYKLICQIGTMVLVIILFFLCLESIQRIRYFYRFKSSYWLKFGFVPKPDDFLKMHERGILRTIEYSFVQYDGYKKHNPKSTTENINSMGFRGEEIGEKKGYRIVALGGSTTFGTGAEDNETYPEYLKRELNCEVINAGVGSAQISHIRHMFEKEIINLEPDSIIINSLINNIYYSDCAYRYRENIFQRINKFLLSKSLFYMTFREKICLLTKGKASVLYKAPLKDIKENFKKETFWKKLKSEYKKIINIAKKRGIKVIIIKQPVRLYKDTSHGALLCEEISFVYEKAYNLFDTLGVVTVDVASKLKKDEYYTSDAIHLTAAGNKYMAEIIAEKIRNDIP